MVTYPNFLLKATRAMTPFTAHGYTVMTIFKDMTIKGTNSNWSFRTPGLGHTSTQFCYTTPLFLSFTYPSIGPHSWYAINVSTIAKHQSFLINLIFKTIDWMWHLFLLLLKSLTESTNGQFNRLNGLFN